MGIHKFIFVGLIALLSCGCASTRTMQLAELPLYGGDALNHTIYLGSDDRFHYFGVQHGFSSYRARVPVADAKLSPATMPYQNGQHEFIRRKDATTVFLATLDWQEPIDLVGEYRSPSDEELAAQELIHKRRSRNPPELPTREEAFDYLSRSTTFFGTAVGPGGATPPTVYAFATLLAQPDRASLFSDLVMQSRSAGKLYGLMGIYLCEPSMAEVSARILQNRREHVNCLSGCSGSTEEIGEIVTSSIMTGVWPTAYAEAVRQLRPSSQPLPP